MRRLSLILLVTALSGCHRTPREKKVAYMERSAFAQEVRVEGHLSARCRISDRPEVGTAVRLFDTGTDALVAETQTGADGAFELVAPRRIDGTYALKVGDFREPLPDGPLSSYHVTLTVPCEADDQIGLLAKFEAHDKADSNARVSGPDGQKSAPESEEERFRLQQAGER